MKHIDGHLYVGVAICTALTASFSTDEAVKYFTPELLFYFRTVVGAFGAGMLAAKMYRSTTFAQTIKPPEPPAQPEPKT